MKVLNAPRLRQVYPRYLVSEVIEEFGALFLLGSGFQDLGALPGSLKCVLAIEAADRIFSSLLSSQSRRAQVLSDKVVKCPLSSSSARQLAQYAGI